MAPSIPGLSTYSRKTRRAAIVGSIGYVLILLASSIWAYGLPDVSAALVSIQIGPWLWWALLGGAIVGAVLIITLVRDRVVTPVLSITILYGVMMYLMWQAMQSPYSIFPPTPLDLYLLGWPLLIVVVLISRFLELKTRDGKRTNGDPNTM